jgi:hypothetical protein
VETVEDARNVLTIMIWTTDRPFWGEVRLDNGVACEDMHCIKVNEWACRIQFGSYFFFIFVGWILLDDEIWGFQAATYIKRNDKQSCCVCKSVTCSRT